METKLKNDDLVSYKMQASNNRPWVVDIYMSERS